MSPARIHPLRALSRGNGHGRAAKVCFGIIAALMLCDYAQLRLSQTLGKAKLVDATLRLGQSAATAAAAKLTTAAAAGLVPVRLQPGLDNPLKKFHNDLKTREGRSLHKWDQYFDVYQRYFQRFVGKEVHMLEIGVQSGGSLEMWKSYFGPNLRYYGVDINPYTKVLFEELPHIKIFVGSQSDRAFWARMRATIPKLDILLDDGGHMMDHQIITFQEMFQHMKDGGIYMTEDCATSYTAVYGGALKKPGTWIEYTKGLIDEGLNADYYKGRTNLTAAMTSMAFYDQMVVFEKGDHKNMSTFPKDVGTMRMDYMPPTLPDGSLDPKVVAQLKAIFKKP